MRITFRVLASIAAGFLVLFAVVMLASLMPVGTSATPSTVAQPTGISALGVQALAASDQCAEWYTEILPYAGAVNMPYTLHVMGCSHASGTWQRGHSHCSVIAYHYAAERGDLTFDYAAVGRKGCDLTPNGSWQRD